LKTIIKWIVLALFIGLLLLASGWWWLFNTQSGAGFVLGQAEGRLERIAWSSMDGTLSDGLTLEQLRVAQSGMQLEIDRLTLAATIRPIPPIKVTIRQLHLNGATLVLPESDPDQPAPAPFELGDFSSPVWLEVQDVELQDVVVQPHGSEPHQIQSLALAGRYHQVLELDRLEVVAPPFQLRLSGQQTMLRPWSTGWAAQLIWQVDQSVEQQVSIEASGTLPALLLEVETRGPLSKTGQVSIDGLPDTKDLSVDVALDGSFSEWPGMDAEVQQIELELSGGLDQWRANSSFNARWQDYPEARIELQATGNLEQATFDPLTIGFLDGQINAETTIGWQDSLTANAAIRFNALDFTSLYPDWPQQAGLSGGFDLEFAGQRLDITNLTAQAPPAALQLSGRATMDLEAEALNTTLEWQSLTWPPVLDSSSTDPLFSSESGQFQASGTLDEWRAELDALLALPGRFNQPQGRLQLEANGNGEEVSQFSGQIRSDDIGLLNLNGQAGFDGTVRADLGLQAFDPSFLSALWPGRINGDLSLSIAPEPLLIELQIDQLGGQLRNLPLDGQGGLNIRQQSLGQADLVLALGGNQLTVASGDGQRWLLEADAGRLDQLWPELSGDLQLNAEYSVDRNQAQWQFNSEQLTFQGYAVREVSLEGDAAWDEQPKVNLDLQAESIDLNPWERFEQVALSLAGDCQQHELNARLEMARVNVELGLAGALPDCLDNPTVWDGQLTQLALTETVWGNWRLDQASSLRLRPGQLTMESSCLQDETAASQLCLQDVALGESGQAALSLRQLPLDLLLLPLNPPVRISSDLTGSMGLSWVDRVPSTIEGQMSLGPGAVRALFSEGDLLSIDQIDLSIQSPDAGSAEAELMALLEAETELNGDFVIPDLSDLASMTLNAIIRLDLPDLGAFNRLVPQLDELGGRVDGELSMVGPVLDPDVSGRLKLIDTHLLYSPLGSRIEQLNLELNANQTEAEFSGGFKAGDGTANISGSMVNQVRDSERWQGRFSIDGEDLQLFAVDWMNMVISPDLEVGFSPERLRFDGSLNVNRARLGLPPGAEQRVEPSPDVVIINAPDDAIIEDEPPPEILREIEGQLAFRLGDDVQLDAAGMQTGLAGNLDINWALGESLPTAAGSIRLVDGAYRSYGQNLEVAQGLVQFTGQPIDNPNLEIEAVREIFGDTQVEQAGVRIRGRAQDPSITLFTTPPTSREKALAYVLTGADFDHAQGQGAFNVGFWVLPNVYVSYGLGLFDTGDVLAARWELSRRWGLRATSGESDTGADLSYTINR